MIRVLQATPTKTIAASSGGSEATVVQSGTGAGPGVVRAIIKTAAPAGQAAHVVRRVQLQPSTQVRHPPTQHAPGYSGLGLLRDHFTMRFLSS